MFGYVIIYIKSEEFNKYIVVNKELYQL